jgi:SAM-dependent methyltransferase
MSQQPPKYQNNLSLQSPILLDERYKQAKVEKMLAILRHNGLLSFPPRGIALDIGCSKGFFTSALSPFFEHVVGLDIDFHALGLARDESARDNVSYLGGDSMKLPFLDNTVDLIICNHVYEHVPDATQLFSEIHRVLTPGGTCYLGAASRLTLIEPHYHLPFLSWLPRSAAHIYMRLTGKGEYYYENLRTHWAIKGLIKGFQVQDCTLDVVADPDLFCARDLFPQGGLLEKIPLSLWRTFYWFLPSYIMLLRKQVSSCDSAILPSK